MFFIIEKINHLFVRLFNGSMLLKSLICIFLSFISGMIKAQLPHRNFENLNISNQRFVIVNMSSDTLLKDSLTILPQSVQIFENQSNTYIDITYFYVKNNVLVLKPQSATRLRLKGSLRQLRFYHS